VKNRGPLILVSLLAAILSPTHAEETDYPQIRWQGWGVRAGLASDPDQVVVGAQFRLGEWAPRVDFTPNVELGFGDDYTILSATAPALYGFRTKTNITPYVGGGVTLGYVDRDSRDSDFKVSLELMGGAEWELKNGNSFFLELDIPFSGFNDVQVLVGWSF
jgi:opacity protein-like surface antigen